MDIFGVVGNHNAATLFKCHFLYSENQTCDQLYNLLLNLQKPTFTSSGLYWFIDHFLLSPCIQVLMTIFIAATLQLQHCIWHKHVIYV